MTEEELIALGKAWTRALPEMSDWGWHVCLSALGTFWQMYVHANPHEEIS